MVMQWDLRQLRPHTRNRYSHIWNLVVRPYRKLPFPIIQLDFRHECYMLVIWPLFIMEWSECLEELNQSLRKFQSQRRRKKRRAISFLKIRRRFDVNQTKTNVNTWWEDTLHFEEKKKMTSKLNADVASLQFRNREKQRQLDFKCDCRGC